jgi:general secretion pathway protein D
VKKTINCLCVVLAAVGLSTAPVAGQTNQTAAGGIQLNFRGAPLETVLEHFASAAGFTINLEVTPRGTVDLFSAKPVSQAEACQLLNSALMKNGYTALRNGNLLTIVSRDDAKTRNIPVKTSNDPNDIPANDEMVTQIIPVQSTEATQLLKDLQPLVSSTTIMTANESANTLVITDTQARIRRVVQIVAAIDKGSEGLTLIRSFRLRNADATEMADLLSQLFPETPSSNSGSSGRQFGGGPGGPGGFGGFGPPGFGGGGGGQSGSGSGSQRLKKGAKVTAVADARTSSVVVSAPKELMGQIEAIVEQLDASPAKRETVQVYKLENASATEVAQVLRDVFQRNTSSQNNRYNSQNNTDTLQTRSQQNQNSSTQSRTGAGIGSSGAGIGGGGSFP